MTFVNAVVLVFLTTAIAAPIMLYGVGLVHSGWTWTHALLFMSIVASTDAVAGTPERGRYRFISRFRA
eukprot:135343-Chlamydomonas_euryale.AAC.6